MLDDLIALASVECTKHGNERTLDCPFCIENGKDTPDTKKHLGVNVKNGKAYCFRCNWKSGDFVRTVTELGRVWGIPVSARDLRVRKRTTPVKPVEAPAPVAEFDPVDIPGYEAFGNKPDRLEREAYYWLTIYRKVASWQVVRHHIGFAVTKHLAGRIIFPVKYLGDTVAWVARSYTEQEPKYLNSSSTMLLWNGHRTGRIAVLSEGIFDGLNVEQAMGPMGEGIVSLARLGSKLTRIHVQQLKKFERTVLLPDWDKAGVDGAVATCQAAVEAGINISVAIPKCMNDSDPGSHSHQQIRDSYLSAVKWEERLVHRMRACTLVSNVETYV